MSQKKKKERKNEEKLLTNVVKANVEIARKMHLFENNIFLHSSAIRYKLYDSKDFSRIQNRKKVEIKTDCFSKNFSWL